MAAGWDTLHHRALWLRGWSGQPKGPVDRSEVVLLVTGNGADQPRSVQWADRLPGSAESLRLPRTVHCSVPRDTPPEPSNTPRLMYFPIPNTTCREPSRAWAITLTFSVHDRSEWATVPKVSIIWRVSVLSAGTSGPCNAHRVNIDDIKCHSWK